MRAIRGAQRWWSIGLGVVVASAASPAWAQGLSAEAKAGARAAAERGSAEFQAGHYKEALDLILRAESLIHATTHLLMLARTHAAMGHLVQAREAYLKAVRDDLAPNAPPAFKRAQADAEKELHDLEPRLASVDISVIGGPPSGVGITMDGTPVPSGLVGLPFPVDPGRHVFRAIGTGFQSPEKALTFTEGQKLSAQLELKPITTTDGAAPPGPLAETSGGGRPSDSATASPSSKRIASFVMMGAGAVGLGVGAAFTALYVSTRGQANTAFNKCGVGCSGPPADNVRSIDNSANVKGDVAIAGFAAGGALAIAGVTLFVLSRPSASAPPRSAAATVTPWVGVGSLGASGSF